MVVLISMKVRTVYGGIWNQIGTSGITVYRLDKLDMFPKHQNNRGDSSETPGLGLTRCLSSKAREVWNSKTHGTHGGTMGPVGPVGFWYLDPLQIWPLFFNLFCVAFFYLRSLEGILFTNCIGRDQQVRREAMYLQFSVFFCIFLYFVRCTSCFTDSMQRNWCLVNAKAREVWCCTVFGVKPLQSLLQSESQAEKRCVTVEVICSWLKMKSKLVRISCFDAWYWEVPFWTFSPFYVVSLVQGKL